MVIRPERRVSALVYQLLNTGIETPTGRRVASADLMAETLRGGRAVSASLKWAASARALLGITPLLLHGGLGLYGQTVSRHCPRAASTWAPYFCQVPQAAGAPSI